MREWIVKYWLSVLFGLLVTGCGAGFSFLTKKMEKIKCENDAMHEAMVALLRSEIITLYNRYEGKGHMPIYARETLHKLHKPYKALGGNGTIDNIMELVDAMPTRPPNDKEESDYEHIKNT